MTIETNAADQLVTIRDFLRYAISRFNQAGLAFGHGASTAFDDAAYLVLEGLKLPIDTLEPFLDARLMPDERRRLADLIEARVATRKPTPYLLNRAYIQGVPFYVDERVIVPRSFIGELIHSEFFGGDEFTLIEDLSSIETVLDLCTGSASLAILAAGVFENAEIDAVDLSPDALEVAKINVAEHGLGNRIELYEGDLFAPLGDKRYDLILTNPPYVDEIAMEELPEEYRHEPEMALASGLDAIHERDAGFTGQDFLKGARAAYEMIVTAFAQGDTRTLKGLLAKDVYDDFTHVIGERQKRGETVETRFVSLDDAVIQDAGLQDQTAHVTVRFTSNLVTATRDKDGEVVDGNPDTVTEVHDVWTFARETASNDPNWKLVATGDA